MLMCFICAHVAVTVFDLNGRESGDLSLVSLSTDVLMPPLSLGCFSLSEDQGTSPVNLPSALAYQNTGKRKVRTKKKKGTITANVAGTKYEIGNKTWQEPNIN